VFSDGDFVPSARYGQTLFGLVFCRLFQVSFVSRSHKDFATVFIRHPSLSISLLVTLACGR
jgi:hypothetical protein